jgi:hypothetical protein
MIVTKLTGGLGNQLFQYALGRKLALKHNTELKLDNTVFETYKLHNYGLDNFNVVGNLASKKDRSQYENESNIAKNFLRGIRQKINPFSIVEEQTLAFREGILKSPDNCFLSGYWQSEQYFSDIRDELLNDLSIKSSLTLQTKEVEQVINKTSTTVSLHIRRGDFVNNEETRDFHGLCSMDYYYEAIKVLEEKIGKGHYFIFSDDPVWAKNNLDIKENVTLVNHNDASTNYEDMYLMSQCDHHIIANSSFSWWGAWLDPKDNKIVIAPKKWLNSKDVDTSTVKPTSWIEV